MRLSAFLLSAIVALLAAATSTRAAEPLAGRLFAGAVGAEKTYACFVRRYDAGHLARHPRQHVSAMKLLVSAETDPESKTLSYSFKLAIRFRGRTETFESGGGCSRGEGIEAGRLGCGVECDGGGIEVILAKDDQSVLMKTEGARVWRNDADDEEQDLPQLGGAGDRAFKLRRASLDACETLMKDHDEVAATSRR
jgi:hypothetical protein